MNHDVVQAVNDYFRFRIMFLGLNSNFIILIPKEDQANRVDKYRPIALDNSLFKVITKIITNHLGIIYSHILAHNQFGLILGCNVRDYLERSLECFNAMYLPCYGGNIALKIDIKKHSTLLDGIFYFKL